MRSLQSAPAPLPSPCQEVSERVYQTGLTVLRKGLPLNQRNVAREIGIALITFKRYLDPYPDLWKIVKRQAIIEFKNKLS